MKKLFYFFLGMLTMWCLGALSPKALMTIGVLVLMVVFAYIMDWFFDHFTKALNARKYEDMHFTSTQDHNP